MRFRAFVRSLFSVPSLRASDSVRSAGVLALLFVFATGIANAAVIFSSGEIDMSYTDVSVTRTVGAAVFTFAGGNGAGGLGVNTGFGGEGLYAYEGTGGGNDVKLTITAPAGTSFDLTSFDAGAATGSITIALTFADGSTTAFVQYGISTTAYTTLSSFSTAINDVTKVVLTSNSYALFQTFAISDVKAIASVPATTNLNGDSVGWAGVSATVALDAGGNATISDSGLDALNGGSGDWSGASLTVQRSGTAVSADTFDFNASGFTVSGSNLQSGGLTFATFTNSSGVLTISFTSSGTAATTALVRSVLRSVTYGNDTPAGNATVRFTVSNGTNTATADVTVTTDVIFVTKTTDTATVNLSDGVSFSEAIGIANAQSGAQYLILSSSFAGVTHTMSGAVTISDSLTLDTGAASGVTLNAQTLTLGAGITLTFTNGTGNTAVLGSILAGTGTLRKTGNGSLELKNAVTSPASSTTSGNMTGDITIVGGTLKALSKAYMPTGTLTISGATYEGGDLNNAIVLGSGGAIFNITNSSSLRGVISGSGTLTKTGTGSLYLYVANSHTGAMTAAAGMLAGMVSNALGSGDVILAAGASLGLAGTNPTFPNHIVLSGDATIIGGSGSATVTLSGGISESGGAHSVIFVNNGGAGAYGFVLTGTATYTGTTTVQSCFVQVADATHLGSGTIVVNSGGSTKSTLQVTGTDVTLGNTISFSGPSVISNANAVTLSGVISGTGAFSKTGSGALTLSGTNTFTGATTLSAGSLLVNGSVSSAVTAASGSTLGGSGTITGNVTVNSGATLAPGSNAVGTLGITGNLSLSGTLAAEIGGTTAGTQYDQVTVNGTVNFANAGGLTLTAVNSFTPGAGDLFALVANDGTDAFTNVGRIAENGSVALGSSQLRVVYTGDSGTPSFLGGNDLVVGLNANPVVSNLNSDSTTFTEKGGAIAIDPGANATVTDSDNANFNGGTVTVAIVANRTAAEDVLAITNQGTAAGQIGVSGANVTYGGVTIGTFTGGTGTNDLVITLNSNATAAATQALLRAITYQDGSTTDPSSATRTIRVTVTDGAGGVSTSADVSIAVNAVNDAPALTTTPATPTFTEGGAAVALFSSTSVSTIESGQSITQLVLTLANLADGASESLLIDGTTVALQTGTGTTADHSLSYSVAIAGSTATVTLTKTGGFGASVAQSVIDGLKYANSSSAPSTATSRVITLTSVADDGGTANGGADTTTLSVAATVTVVGVNNAPVLTVTGGSAAFVEGDNVTSTPVVVDGGLSVTDADNTTLAIATVSITGGFQPAEDVLAFTNTNSATFGNIAASYSAGTGVLTLTSSGAAATVAQWQAALRAVIYTNTSDSPNTTTRVVSFQANDGTADSAAVTRNVTVTSVNDAPVVVTSGATTAFTEGNNVASTPVAIDPGVTVSDADNTTLATGTVSITGSFQSGEDLLAFSNTDAATYGNILGSYNSVNGVLTLTSSGATASVAQWQAALRAVTYTNASNSPTPATRTVAFAVSDGTATAAATTQDVSVTAVDDTPTNIALAGSSVNQSAGSNAAVGTLTATDADSAIFTYSLVSGTGATDNASFTISGSSLRAVNAAALAAGAYSVRIQVDDGAGGTFAKSFAITVVDDIAPSVTSVAVPANGAYRGGQSFDFTVNFSEAITVNSAGGTPYIGLTLNTGGAVQAAYVSGSGTNALLFRYTVATGNLDPDGVTVGALAANGGTLKDGAGNNADLTLNSVASTAGVLVDAVVPTVSAVTRVDATPSKAASVGFTVTFSEAVTGVDAADFTVNATDTAAGDIATVSAVNGSTYTVTVNAITGDGTLRLDVNNSGTGIQDSAGNALNGGFTAGETYTFDHTAPSAPAVATITADTGSSSTDGITSDQTLVFNGTAEANATLTVSKGGTTVGTTTANGSGAWTFDYTGTTLADGTYTFTATPTDAVGNTGVASSGFSVVVDTTAPATPAITAISPDTGTSATDQITSAGALTLSGTAEADSTVTVSRVGTGVIGTATANGSGAWSFDYTGTTLGTGTHSFTATATDAAGNASGASATFYVTVDASTTAPAITAISNDSGANASDGVTNDATLVFTGTAEKNGTVSLSRTGAGVIGTATADGAGAWSFDYTGTTLSDGVYVFTATVTDPAGNTSASSADFPVTIDTTAPAAPAITAIGSDTGASSSDAITSDATLTLSGTAEANAVVAISRAGIGQIGTVTAANDGAWTFDYTGTTLADGAYTFTATATDAVGNTGVSSSGFSVVVDTTAPAAPAITAISPDTGTSATDQITSAGALTLSGTAEADSTVTVSRVGTGVIGTATANGSGAWSFDYTGTTLGTGTHSFTASATDAAGNASGASATFYVTVDASTTAPVITAISNDSGANASDGVTNDATLVFTGTAEKNGTVTLSRTGVGVIGTATADSAGAWSFDYTGTTLSDGVYVFTATVTDPAGNTSASSADFPVTIDTTAPAAPAITAIGSDTGASSSDAITSDATLTLSGTAEANAVVAISRAGIGEVASVTTANDGKWTFDYTGTTLADGTYTFMATAKDTAGNTSAASANFLVTVDTAAPVIGSATTADATYKAAFSFSVTATGGPVTYAATNLPAGLSLDPASGLISGQPAQSGSFAVALTVTDTAGNAGTATLALTVHAATLTVSGITASNKVYDASAAATLSTSGATLVGVATGDVVTLSTTGASGAFADKSVGAGRVVTISGLTLGGADAANYTVTQPTTTASITVAPLSVSGVTAANRTYDGTASAGINLTGAALVGVIGADVVTLNTGSATATFADANVGPTKAVTVSGLTIAGADAGNYVLTQPTTSAAIGAATLTVTGVTAADKVYDGTRAAVLNVSGATLVGAVGGDVLTLGTSGAAGAFADKLAGSNKAVTISGISVSGPSASNYTLVQPTTTASITRKPLSVTGITAASRVYDGGTGAVLSFSGAMLGGVETGDVVTLDTSGASGAFADKSVGAGRVVTISGLTLGGADAVNYTVTQPTTTASITAAPLSVSGVTAANKTYDGTASASIDVTGATLVGVIGADVVTLDTGTATATFADANVGATKAVTVSGLTIAGADAGNYVLTQPTTTAAIGAATLTVTGVTAADKVYDGTAAAVLNLAGATLVGAVGGDVLTLGTTGAAGVFADKLAGSNKAVTISGLSVSGPSASNYTLVQPTTTASITRKPLSVTGITAASRVYDGGIGATLNLSGATLSGVETGDVVTLDTSAASGAFADKQVGLAKPVTVSGLTLAGADAANYTLAAPALAADVTAKTLTVTGISVANKVYDGTTTATLNTSGATLVGVVSGDVVSLATGAASGAFSAATAGTAKPVSVTGLELAGADATNYTLVAPGLSADVTQAPVTVTLGDLNQVYNGSPRTVSVTTSVPVPTTVTYAGSATPPVSAGSYAVVATVSDPNYTGSATATLAIAKASQTISFTAPGNVAIGTPVSLSATSNTGLPVTFSVISGPATLAGSTLTVTGAGAVTVRATQAGDANYNPASANVTIGSVAKLAQTIAFAALADKRATDTPFALVATASSGLPVTFAVISGPALLAGNTLTLSGAPGRVIVRASQSGNDQYAAAADVTQEFSVSPVGPQVYFGHLGSSPFAASISADGRSGTMIGTIPGTGEGFIVTFTPEADGTWTATVNTLTGASTALAAGISGEVTTARSETEPPRAAAGGAVTRTFRGQLNGTVLTGSIDGTNLTFSAQLASPVGPTATIAGYYQSSSLETATGVIYSIVGTQNQVYVLAVTPGYVGGNSGTAATTGAFTTDLGAQAAVVGNVDAATTMVTGTLTRPSRDPEAFAGIAVSTVRADRLLNLSSRARVTNGVSDLITGFVIGGAEPKTVLLRAVGPSLSGFGVRGALAGAKLRLYDAQGKMLREVRGWNADPALPSTFARLGAFGLADANTDSALVTTLAPGLYTMQVVPAADANGNVPADGVAMAEIYDASANPQSEYQRLVNISSRGHIDAGEGVLIGGFVIGGNAPKRLLIRGVGPALGALGVADALANPVLSVYAGDEVIARNDDWNTAVSVSPTQVAATADMVAAATRQVGAFALPAGSRDAAVIITLAPGSYTAVVGSADRTTGTGLIEVYEVPEN